MQKRERERKIGIAFPCTHRDFVISVFADHCAGCFWTTIFITSVPIRSCKIEIHSTEACLRNQINLPYCMQIAILVNPWKIVIRKCSCVSLKIRQKNYYLIFKFSLWKNMLTPQSLKNWLQSSIFSLPRLTRHPTSITSPGLSALGSLIRNRFSCGYSPWDPQSHLTTTTPVDD